MCGGRKGLRRRGESEGGRRTCTSGAAGRKKVDMLKGLQNFLNLFDLNIFRTKLLDSASGWHIPLLFRRGTATAAAITVLHTL